MDIHTTLRRMLRNMPDPLQERLRNLWRWGVGLRHGLPVGRDAITELRFSDLKAFIATQQDAWHSVALADSIERLRQRAVGRSLAVVSPLPPADTGIANFSLQAFSNMPEHTVDFFANFPTVEAYLAASHFLFDDASPFQAFNMDVFIAGLKIRNYEAVIWVLGNSDHHVATLRALKAVRYLRTKVPFFVEVHDPYLLNVVAKFARTEGMSLRGMLAHDAPRDLTGMQWAAIEGGDHRPLVERGVTGLSAALRGVACRGLIVHSSAAADILRPESNAIGAGEPVKLFHPVFDAFKARDRYADPGVGQELRLGSFGVPGAAKQTQKAVLALRELASRGTPCSLLLAGYGAQHYAQLEGLLSRPDVHVEDKPSTERLLALMEGIDVGVQLRAVNTGESSGIVPQLLSRDTPVVLSRVGSFAEYDDVVTAVPVGCSAAELVEALSGELRDAPRKSTLRRAYVDAHSPARFCEALMAAIRAPANPSCAPVPLRPRGPALALAATRQETPANWDAFEAVMRAVGVNENPYVKSHIQRYRSTLMALESLEVPAVAVGLELGTSWLFPQVMRNTLGFARVDVTDFQGPDAPRTRQVEVAGGRDGPVMLSAFNVNLESDPLPAADETYDLVICCEVIEHLDVDPMFMMAEINRVTKPGGYLLLTTPNVTSSRNARKMLLGYAPHFYMQYHKDRNPYRHNIEYAPNQLREIIASSGFKIWRFWTLDNFDTPDAEIISYLGRNGWKTEERGDNMFVLGQKTSGVTDRYPPSIYV